MMRRQLHLAYSSSKAYLMPTMVSVASAIAWASRRDDLVFHILNCGFSEEDWNQFVRRIHDHLSGSYQLIRHDIDMSVFDAYPNYHGGRGTFARLMLPDLLRDVQWCVYVDGDTLFTADPFELEHVFDDKYAYQGHEDWFDLVNLPQKKICEEIGREWRPDQYVCAGFILMNLDWLRRHDLFKKSIAFISESKSVARTDQDALYYVGYGNIGILPSEWGMFSWQIFLQDSEIPKLIHYASDLPWKFDCIRYLGYVDDRCIWLRYAKRLLGLTMREIGCPGQFRFFRLRLYTNLWRVVVFFASALPRRRAMYQFISSRFATRRVLCKIGVDIALGRRGNHA